MNSTIRTWVSELANDVNAITPDARLSKRYLFQKLLASANYYMRQLSILELIRNYNYSVVDCFEMETVSTINCCSFDIPNCKTVQKSINEIPEFYGSVITAYTLDDDPYTVVTARKFKNIVNDTEYYNPEDGYAYIENKHLIIPNSEVETIKLGGYFINPIKAKECGCNNDIDNCYSPLDEPFNIPDKIASIVKKDALQSILTKLQISKDETPNSNLNQK